MKDFQRTWCQKILDKVRARRITGFLEQELLQTGSQLSFETIARKLRNSGAGPGNYKTVEEWVKDVNLVFFSVKSSVKPGSAQEEATDYLAEWFKKKTQRFPESEMDVWMMKFKKVQRRLKALMECQVKFL